MKNDVDKIINDFFMPHTVKKSADQLTINELFSLVKEVESALPLFEQQDTQTSDITIKLPQIRITENWGKPSNKDREIIESFTSKFQGNTIYEKIEDINKTINNFSDPNLSVSKILSCLVILSCLRTLKNDFSPGSAGIIFESFVAGLFGQTAQQIKRQHGEKDRIEDLEFAGTSYSLKFIKESTDISGSFKNLVDFFSNKQEISYLVAVKMEKSIIFYEYVLNRRNYHRLIDGIKINNKNNKKYLDEVLQSKFEDLNKTQAYINETQFTINKRNFEDRIDAGELNCGEEYILDLVSKCAVNLNNDLFPIYQTLSKLSENINTYFLSEDGNQAVKAASSASNNARELQSKFSVLADPKNLKS